MIGENEWPDCIERKHRNKSYEKYLGPHLLNILKDHVAMSIKSPHTAKKLPVITTIDEDLLAQWEPNWIRNIIEPSDEKNTNI